MSGYSMDDYVDVAERVAQFYERHPEGRIQTDIVELRPDLVIVRAKAFQTPDDPTPSTGHSMLGIPGTTNFTRGSEVENAETSAVGRAIAFLGFAVKHGIASKQEVRNKSQDGGGGAPPAPAARPPDDGIWEGTPVAGPKAPVDALLRQTPDGGAFGFVLMVDRDGRPPQRVQVMCHGDMAAVVATAWQMHKPQTATVWGAGEQVPFTTKDGKSLTYLRVRASRVMTEEWTVPATDGPRPAKPEGEKTDDLDSLPF